MKLYALTTSERASKGQGGNDYLEISISGENEAIVMFMKVTMPLSGKYHVDIKKLMPASKLIVNTEA